MSYAGSHEAGWARHVAGVVPFLALAYVAIAAFRVELLPIAVGLDDSWAYALNRLPSSGFDFGADVVFTYGPLGYLVVPREVGGNLAQALALRVAAHIALIGVAASHLLRDRRVWSAVAFAALLLAGEASGMLPEYRLLISLAAILTIEPRDGLPWRVAAPVAAAFAGLLLFTKFTAGTAAAVMLVATAAVWTIRRDAPLRLVGLFVGVPYAATVVAIALITLGSPAGFFDWLGRSFELASGYPTAMGVPEPSFLVVMGAVAVAAIAGAAVVLWRAARRIPIGLMAIAPMIALAFRHGYVRHHGSFLFAVVLGGLALLVLSARGRKAVVAVAVAGAVAAGAATFASTEPACRCAWRAGAFAPMRGLKDLVRVADLGDTRAQLRAESGSLLAAATLPEAWRAELAEATVDVIPGEISLVPANGLEWIPNPVIQTYHVFTSELDALVAGHFRSDGAPSHVIVEFRDIDGRHPMAAAPAMWRALIERYEPAPVGLVSTDDFTLALLQRRDAPTPLQLRAMSVETASATAWIEVPPSSDGLTFAAMELQQNGLGRVRTLLWRLEPMYIELEYEDGSREMRRVVPGTLDDGLLIDPLPRTLDRLLRLLEGQDLPGVTRFRLLGPGLESYGPQVSVRWLAADAPPPAL